MLSRICYSCRYPEAGNRVKDVVVGLANSQTIKEIAIQLSLSVKTVEYHWAMAKVKLGFQCYQDAVKYAIKQGWITL